ncbi:hypothetical protein TcWFU_007384 [Taenia crassiceps]|uniref:Uncharacterized protein n=1 Tax=Taenia crassiceps TaxID=6207 RepID=A0ABR4QRR8_9CEST
MNSCDSKFLERDFVTFVFALRGLQAHGYAQKQPLGFPSVSRIPTAEPGDSVTPSAAIQPISRAVQFQGADFSLLRSLWKFNL